MGDAQRGHLLWRREPAGRDKVAAISTSTGNRLSASARFREMIEPTGVADELRVAFSDAYGMWMSLVLFTERRMTDQDLRFVADVVPGATSAMRDAALSPESAAGPGDPPTARRPRCCCSTPPIA